ncbi:hypothetical protein VTK73DRAFT_5974 [Phialemonium thermophilum]|uniref:Uncharacterized protein n=1 Tax=Phialemonium thermophilum TaxID=223376 RepID=A0ABR3V0T8_9PEZI
MVGAAVDAQALADPLAEEADALVGDVDALDAADAAGEGHDVALELAAHVGDELVRQVEDQDGGVAHGVGQRRVGAHVVGQADALEVLHVLVAGVDDLGELARLVAAGRVVVRRVAGEDDLLLVDPHLHRLFEDVRVLARVLGDDLGDGGPPVAGADDGDLVPLLVEAEAVGACHGGGGSAGDGRRCRGGEAELSHRGRGREESDARETRRRRRQASTRKQQRDQSRRRRREEGRSDQYHEKEETRQQRAGRWVGEGRRGIGKVLCLVALSDSSKVVPLQLNCLGQLDAYWTRRDTNGGGRTHYLGPCVSSKSSLNSCLC